MSDVALNTQSNIGHAEVTYSMLRKNTFLGALCQAVVELWGRAEEGCTWGFEAFEGKLRVSRSTVRRHFKKKSDDELFEVGRMGEKRCAVRYLGELKKEKYIRVDYWFRTETFLFTYRDKETERIIKQVNRRLTPSEVKFLAFVYTLARNRQALVASYSDIAGILNMTLETACRVAQELIAADLIVHAVIGTNGRKNEFKLKWSTFSDYAEVHKKVKKSAKKTAIPAEENAGNVSDVKPNEEKTVPQWKADAQKAIEAADAKTVREQFYTRLKEERERKAAQYEVFAYRKNPTLKKLAKELEEARKQENSAILHKSPLYTVIQARVQKLEAERCELIKRLGLNVEMFHEEFYGKQQCPLCLGTGWQSDDRGCTCYLSRGEP